MEKNDECLIIAITSVTEHGMGKGSVKPDTKQRDVMNERSLTQKERSEVFGRFQQQQTGPDASRTTAGWP